MEITISLLPQGVTAIKDNLQTPSIEHKKFTLNGLHRFRIDHPNPVIDLCAFNVSGLFSEIFSEHAVRHFFLSEYWLPTDDQREILRAIEPIVMVGYPNGLWDQSNNLPVVRNGLTASHPLVSWNGKREFLIDAACFPGSSGSPMFHFQDGMYRSKGDSYSPGTAISLLGILWGGPLISIEGRIDRRELPTSMNDVPVISTMMNLGFAIRSDAINDLKPLITRGIS
jgi:hypothetical protein